MEQFTKVKEEIEALIGREATSELLSKSLFVVVSGSNDWVNTYFFPGSPLPKLYTVPQYRDLLLEKFFSQIQVCFYLALLVKNDLILIVRDINENGVTWAREILLTTM